MYNTAKIVPLPTTHPSFFSGIVAAITEDQTHATIRNFDGASDGFQIPLNLQNYIAPGDEVLCTGKEQFFILNILKKQNSQTIRAFSANQELLFEYDPATNKSRVFIDQGDLEFISSKGDISFKAANNLNFSANSVDVSGATQVHIGVTSPSGRKSAVKINQAKLGLTSPHLEINSNKGTVLVDDLRLIGRKWHGTISTVQLVSKKLEIAAKTITQKAENIFQKVTGLSQLRAGRKHEIIDATYHLKAKQTILKSENDFKVKAEKIHLG